MQHHGRPDAAEAARRLRTLRAELVALLEDLPETRLGAALERPGWTLRHDLAALAAFDVELPHVLDRLRAGAPSPLHLRRFRGEAMFEAQQLRLRPLRERLATGVEAAAAALEDAGDLLERPLDVAGRGVSTGHDYVYSALRQAESAVHEARRLLGR
jgi:hypothetical protein